MLFGNRTPLPSYVVLSWNGDQYEPVAHAPSQDAAERAAHTLLRERKADHTHVIASDGRLVSTITSKTPNPATGSPEMTSHSSYAAHLGRRWFSDPAYLSLRRRIEDQPATWLVTGAAGFIGSNLLETLLLLGQKVVGLDNFSTGYRRNLSEVERSVGPDRWSNFELIEGDIRERSACEAAVQGIDYVLHQAAIGSVPWSINQPLTFHDVNVTGFMNILDAARRAGVRRFVYAASSATYGDEASTPAKSEEKIGSPLSPYAANKLMNEVCASLYARVYGFRTIGLRYFNVFGPRQDPEGAYAAVIPAWAAAMIKNEKVEIFGDGSTSRDFCYVANVVQANIRAACAEDAAQDKVFNVAVGRSTSLNELFVEMKSALDQHQINYTRDPIYSAFRDGDVRHSLANISKAQELLDYLPSHGIQEGLMEAIPWYLELFRSQNLVAFSEARYSDNRVVREAPLATAAAVA